MRGGVRSQESGVRSQEEFIIVLFIYVRLLNYKLPFVTFRKVTFFLAYTFLGHFWVWRQEAGVIPFSLKLATDEEVWEVWEVWGEEES